MKKLIIITVALAVVLAAYAEVSQNTVSVTPYAESTVSLGYAKSVRINAGGKSVRVGLNDITTVDTDKYWTISSSDQPLDITLWQTTTLRFKGDTASDTTTVRLLIQK